MDEEVKIACKLCHKIVQSWNGLTFCKENCSETGATDRSPDQLECQLFQVTRVLISIYPYRG